MIAAEILGKILDVANLRIITLSIYQPTPFRANINAYRLPIDLYRALHRFTNKKPKRVNKKNIGR